MTAVVQDHIFGLQRRKIDHKYWLFYCLVVFGAIVIQLSGLTIGRWGVDAASLDAAVKGDAGGVATSLGDQAVVFLTPYLGFGSLPNLLPTLFLAYIISRVAYQGSLLIRLAIFYLAFPVVFQLQFVSKEAIVTLFVIALFLLNSAPRLSKFRVLASFLLLLFIALNFRNYYLISFAFALCIYVIPKRSWGLVALVAGICVTAFIDDIREPLMQTRYFIYNGVSDAAASKIPLLFDGRDVISYVGNYFVSLFFYTFPITTGFRIQEIYMQLYVVLVAVFSARAWVDGNRLLFSIFMGMMLTLPIFVAEVGTIARHLSGFLPILLMAMYFPKQEPKVKGKRTASDTAGRLFGSAPVSQSVTMSAPS